MDALRDGLRAGSGRVGGTSRKRPFSRLAARAPRTLDRERYEPADSKNGHGPSGYNQQDAPVLFWTFLAAISFVALAGCVLIIAVGATRAPRRFSPRLLALLFFAVALPRLVDWVPVPIHRSVDIAVWCISTAVIVYFLYRSGPMLEDFIRRWLHDPMPREK